MNKSEAREMMDKLTIEASYMDDHIDTALIEAENKEEFEECLSILGWNYWGNNDKSDGKVEMLYENGDV